MITASASRKRATATVRRNAVITKSMDALVWLRKQLETGDNDLLP